MGFLYSPQSTARLVDAARPYNASYRIPFRSVGKEKTGRSRVTVIFMSLVRSLVPFGVFQCFSGFLTVKLTQILRLLSEAMLNHAKAVVVTRPAEDFPEKDQKSVIENTQKLESYGIEVRRKEGFHQKFTVIDGQTVWYGSVNFLSFGTAEESIMRFTSHDIAGRLIDTVLQ